MSHFDIGRKNIFIFIQFDYKRITFGLNNYIQIEVEIQFKYAICVDIINSFSLWKIIIDGFPSGTDLERPSWESIEIYLNSDNPATQHLFKVSDNPHLSASLRSALKWEVGRKLLELTAVCEDLKLDHEYPSNSVGELLQCVVSTYFNDLNISQIRDFVRNRPEEIEPIIQNSQPIDLSP